MKTLTAQELKGILKNISLDFDKYEENCNKYLEFEFKKVCVVADVNIIANKVKDTSELDYFTGTGYSSEVVTKGYVANVNSVNFYYDDELVSFDKKNTELILNKIKEL